MKGHVHQKKISVTIPKLLIHKIMMSLLKNILAVGIVTVQMGHTTSNTKIDIEFILNIECIGLAPDMSVKVLSIPYNL